MSFFILNCYFTINAAYASGVTIITHGFESGTDGWIHSMRSAIVSRAAKEPGTNCALGSITVTTFGEVHGADDLNVDIFIPNLENYYSDAPMTEIMISLDWSDIDGIGFETVVTDWVAQAVFNKIIGSEYEQIFELPIHLIGHSRGGTLVCELAKLLGQIGISVDHVTTLDPRNAGLDPVPKIYTNVLFADNYYQENIITFPDGLRIEEAYNRKLLDLSGGYDYMVLPHASHADTHLWYHGTIEDDTPFSDGEAEITEYERSYWWEPGEGAGLFTGFYFSRIFGGNRYSHYSPNYESDTPFDGYHYMYGGDGSRFNLDWSNATWPNIITCELIKNGVPIGGDSAIVESGETIEFRYLGQDYDSSSVVTLYLDVDRNPYNNNNILTIGNPVDHNETGTEYFTNSINFSISTISGTIGYIYAKISDGTNTRYMYARPKLEFFSGQVPFKDPNLKTAIEQQLGIANPTVSDMLGLTYLWASDVGIVDLSGLEYADNLENLYVHENGITDLSPLATLTNLKSLVISYNPIADFGVIANLINLNELVYFNYDDQFHGDIPISGLTKLTRLRLEGVPLPDLSPLSNLTNLNYLELWDNGVTDISALSELTNIESLSIVIVGNNDDDSKIEDFSPLLNLINLTTLSIRNKGLDNISVLSGLTNLTGLYLRGNGINDIAPLSNLTNLNYLSLSWNSIIDISPLSTLQNLIDLRFDFNPVQDITVLSELKKLTTLLAFWALIVDISPLAELTNLQTLRLDGPNNNISDISALSSLSNLVELNLENNPLNNEAVETYIPIIKANNPGIDFSYGPIYTLNLSSSGGGVVTDPGEGSYQYGEDYKVPLEAIPENEFNLSSWSGTDDDTLKSTTNFVTMDSDKIVSVSFKIFGSLTVNLSNPDALNAGAQWALSSGPDLDWKNSGQTINLLPGEYVIIFKETPGFISPESQTIDISTEDHIISFDYLSIYSSGYGTENNPFIISDINDFIKMQNHPNSWSKYFQLASDIDLGNYNYKTAIIAPDLGSTTNEFDGVPFNGVFDGQGHTISNIHINGNLENEFIGVFGYIGDEGIIRNLNVNNINIVGYNSKVGGLCGGNNGEIDNCTSSGSFLTPDIQQSISIDSIGGICGYNYGEYAIISNSNSTFTISIGTDTSNIGGISGYNYKGSIVNCQSVGNIVSQGNSVGGICGNNHDGNINQSFSSGNVSGNNNVGGLCGYNRNGIISTCNSSGVINGQEGSTGVGGFCGQNISYGDSFDSTQDAIISDSYSTGNVIVGNSSIEIGGFCGKNISYAPSFAHAQDAIIKNSYSTGNVTAGNNSRYIGGFCGNSLIQVFSFGDAGDPIIQNCHSLGNVIVGDSSSFIGGLCGQSVSGAINDCFSAGNVSAGSNILEIGGLCGRNSQANIKDCFSSGSVNTGDNSKWLGGLCGRNVSNASILDSYSTGNVRGGNDTSYIGGLCGTNESTIQRCFSIGDVNANDVSSYYVGGLVGYNWSLISNSYSLSKVENGRRGGGLLGNNNGGNITNCFSAGMLNFSFDLGYMVASNENNGIITNSYWDVEVANWHTEPGDNNFGAVGMSTLEMKAQETYLGWDFVDESINGTQEIWRMPADNYPQLNWQRAAILKLSGEPEFKIVDDASHTFQYAVENIGNDTMNWSTTILSGEDWISIKTGLSGVNSGTISVEILSNITRFSRMGKILITASETSGSPKMITIMQLGSTEIDIDSDGIPDSVEDKNLNGIVDADETDPCDPDTDGDGIQDGTELGYTLDDISSSTNTNVFIPDADNATVTDPLLSDSDGDGYTDGQEDKNFNGRVDQGESDPVDINSISVNLEDAVMALKVLIRTEPCPNVNLINDVGGDSRIGLKDAIYIIQQSKQNLE